MAIQYGIHVGVRPVAEESARGTPGDEPASKEQGRAAPWSEPMLPRNPCTANVGNLLLARRFHAAGSGILRLSPRLCPLCVLRFERSLWSSRVEMCIPKSSLRLCVFAFKVLFVFLVAASPRCGRCRNISPTNSYTWLGLYSAARQANEQPWSRRNHHVIP
jgi:hypothetical protein